MKKVKKLLAMALATVMVAATLVGCGGKTTGGENAGSDDTVKVGVFLYKFDDTYISTVRQALQKIQDENSGKVEFEFFDGKGDQATQNDTIDTALQKDYDLLLVNLVDTGAGQTVVDKIKAAEKPVVLFNREPAAEVVKSYEKAIFVGTNAIEAGIMQGDIIAAEWEANKDKIDKNGDGVLQYVMLQGEPDNPEAVARTEYSVSTLKDKGMQVEELAKQVCNWDQALAQNAMEAWLSNHGDKIEAVIANNDGMALGAIAALQAQGYNTDSGEKSIIVVGVDATTAAQEYIAKGYMLGSVLQDAEGMAKALYETGLNLATGKGATEGTSYKFDDTGVAIRIPYQPYLK
ncbi:galactose ABC transporter substrate-binding protein [Clostridium isatidis]|uniref:galactose ABC transporter substrate-binding protein n=1 Tax=Clostridium isatidis TaxID=182773 RepID=UPI003AB0FE9F